MSAFKKIQLYISTDITPISNYCTVGIIHFNVFQIVNVMYACFCQVK